MSSETTCISFGSLPLCLLVGLSGSYVVLAANGPHLPGLPSPPLSTSSHSCTNCCVFLAAPLPFLQVLSISFWVSGAHYSASAILVADSWGWKGLGGPRGVCVCTCIFVCVLVSIRLVHGDPGVIQLEDRWQITDYETSRTPVERLNKLLAWNKNKLCSHYIPTISLHCLRICSYRQCSWSKQAGREARY